MSARPNAPPLLPPPNTPSKRSPDLFSIEFASSFFGFSVVEVFPFARDGLSSERAIRSS